MNKNLTSVILNGARSSTQTSGCSCQGFGCGYIHSLHYGRCHSSKEHSQALSQRSFLSHLQRDQALAQLSKGHFLTQAPQRSLKRFLADPWGKEFTAGSMDGTSQQNGAVLHRAVGRDPVGDTDRAHKQGNIREGSPLWLGEEHLTALEAGGSLHGLRDLVPGKTYPGREEVWQWGLLHPELTVRLSVSQSHSGLSISHH